MLVLNQTGCAIDQTLHHIGANRHIRDFLLNEPK